MITLVGVGHVFDIKDQVRQIIHKELPSVVAVELDRGRLIALGQKNRGESMPFIYKMAARFQNRIAGEFGAQPGEEMLSAIQAAKEVNASVALIDMDMDRTLGEIRNSITFEEKVKLMVAVFASLFVRKKMVEKELKRYQESEEQYLDEFGRMFPNIKKVLIDKRNEFMANSIRELASMHASVLAVVGDGHVPGLSRLLQDLDPKTLRLADVRNWEPADDDSENITYSFTVEG